MRLGRLGNYWNQTETFEALQLYIDMNFEGLRDDILSMLAGEEVPVIQEVLRMIWQPSVQKMMS